MTAPEILHILQHSLGLDQYGRGRAYRNYFCTGAGSVDHPICMAAVKAGLMDGPKPGGQMYGGMDFFYVNDAGKKFVAVNSPDPPKISRAQRRYQKFLVAHEVYDMSFREFLSTDMAKV